METNTVLITTTEYSDLIKLKNGIEQDRVYVKGSSIWDMDTWWYTKDEAVELLFQKNQKLYLKINELKYPPKEKPNFEQMSVWQFIKYKLNKKDDKQSIFNRKFR